MKIINKKNIALVILLFFAQGIVADIISFTSSHDTMLYEYQPDIDLGGMDWMQIGLQGDNERFVSLLKFDVTSLAGQYSQINSITWRFFLSENLTYTNSCNVFLLREGNANWEQGSGSGVITPNAATWAYRKYDSEEWLGGTNGAYSAADQYGSLAAFTLTSAGQRYDQIDVSFDASTLSDANVNSLTKIMDMWTRNSGADNAGIVVHGGDQFGTAAFFSSEHTNATLRPLLIIDYAAIPEPTTAGFLVMFSCLAIILRRVCAIWGRGD